MTYDDTTTIQDVLRAWDTGESIWSVEMGGLGPGYEQAIQVLVVELLREYHEAALPIAEEQETWGDAVVHRINVSCGGFSGAQVGAAKQIAYRMLRDGYARTLVSVDVDRRILVSNDWPRASTPVLQEQT